LVDLGCFIRCPTMLSCFAGEGGFNTMFVSQSGLSCCLEMRWTLV
jgi:hypothetical protein